MAAYTQTYEWGRWKGTLDEIARLAKLAVDDLCPTGGDPREFSMTIDLKGGLEIRLSSVEDLSHFTDRDPADIMSVRVAIQGRLGTAELIFRDQHSLDAVRVTTQGSDESRTHGLAVRLKTEIDHGARALRWLGPGATLPVLMGGVGLIIGAVPAALIADHNWPVVWAGLGVIVIVGMLLVDALLPPLELYRLGAPLRVSRWGTSIIAAATVLGVILALVALSR